MNFLNTIIKEVKFYIFYHFYYIRYLSAFYGSTKFDFLLQNCNKAYLMTNIFKNCLCTYYLLDKIKKNIP